MGELRLPDPSVTDEGRRLHEAVTLHFIAQGFDVVGKVVAARLSDGGTDGVLYDTVDDAIRHQLHETQCAYLTIPPSGTTEREATRFLQVWRQMYNQGIRNLKHAPAPVDLNPLWRGPHG